MRLATWQERFIASRDAYREHSELMDERDELYAGSHEIDVNPERGTGAARRASSCRNIVFELVEAQVDSTIPAPRVTARDPESELHAKEIEDMLSNELDRIPFEYINDADERTTVIQGGDFFLVEWDSTKRTHTAVGELSVRLIHPKQLIPQKGKLSIEDSDYIFILLTQSKGAIKKKYGVSVESEVESNPEIRGGDDAADELVTQIIAYYRSNSGTIGRVSWVNDTLLESRDDYFGRSVYKCSQCGARCTGIVCACGGKCELSHENYDILSQEIVLRDERGKAYRRIPRGAKIPRYAPRRFPIVLRKNVSIYSELLGNSDVDFIRDQQNNIKKLLTKIDDKIYKAGSYLTLPVGVNIPMTDEELKVIKINDPAQKSMIDMFNIQPDIGKDLTMISTYYESAKETLGITDSFLGRRDPTATSGRAKEFAAGQSAGRLESKRVMKRAAYAELFCVMFQFMLAYTDEPRSYVAKDRVGNRIYKVFNRYDFLERDEAGEWYWNDEYLFGTDSAAALASNREAMWQETRMNFQQGAFGAPNDVQALHIFWNLMNELHYPGAAHVLAQLDLAQQEAAPQEGMPPMDAPQMGAPQMPGMM